MYCKLNLTLKGSKPRVWRRIVVDDSMCSEDFMDYVMAIFHMDGFHLYELIIPGERPKLGHGFAQDFSFDEPEEPQEEEETLAELFDKGIKRMTFLYDFGDGWEVDIRLEGRMEELDKKVKKVPCVLRGAGYGIIEDVGGIWMLNAIAAGDREILGEFEEWDLPDLTDFDPEDF